MNSIEVNKKSGSRLYIIVLLALIVMATSTLVPVKALTLGYDIFRINPASGTNGMVSGDWATDAYYKTENGNLYFFGSEFGWLYYCVSTDNGITWSNQAIITNGGAGQDAYIFSGYMYGQSIWVVNNTIHVAGRYNHFPVFRPIGLYYSRLTSNVGGSLTIDVQNTYVYSPSDMTGIGMNMGMAVVNETIVIAVANVTTNKIDMYRSPATQGTNGTFSKFSYGVGLDIVKSYVQVYEGYEGVVRVVVSAYPSTDPSDYDIHTFTHDNEATWDASGINNYYLLSCDSNWYELCSVVDSSYNLHVLYVDRASRQEFHAIISDGSLVQNSFKSNTANITRLTLREYGYGSLFYFKYDLSTEKFFYQTYVDGVWNTRTIAHFDDTKTFTDLPLITKQLPDTEDFRALVQYDGIGDVVISAINFTFKAGDPEAPLGTPPLVASIGDIRNNGDRPYTNSKISWWAYNLHSYVKRIVMEYNLGTGDGWQTRFDILNTVQNRTDSFDLFLPVPHNTNIGLRMTMYANDGGFIDTIYHNFTALYNDVVVGAGFDTDNEVPNGYLFVYQEYQFKIDTIGMNETIKFSFSDGDTLFNMTWDRAGENSTKTGTNILEVTRVAYTYEPFIEEYNYTIYFIFPQEIYDCFNQSFHYQTIGVNTSAWISTPAWYHVYNIGGFTNYDSTGWAGKISGGSAYEIFASDTRAPIMVDLYNFDIRPNPVPASDSESDLINFLLSDWSIHNPYRTATADMHPTNRLTSYATTSWRAYTSYPFGLRIYDDNVAANRQLYLEKTFRRRISTISGEDVIAQVNMMNPDVDVFAGQFRLQQDSIFETGSGKLISQIRFDAASNLDMYNFSSGLWVDLLAVSDYIWYNVTVHVNFTGLSCDVYINSVLKADNMPFADNTADSVNAVFFGTINTVTTLNDFYIDDLEIHTNLSDLLGGIVEANTVYRKLQQWSMKYGFGIEQPDGVHPTQMANGWVEQAIDLMIDGVWVEHIRYQIKPIDVSINFDNNWIKWQVDWYRANRVTPSKTDYIFTLFESDVKLPSEILQRDLSSFFSDIWIGTENASSVVGGRINGEWYGISDKAPFYQFWRNDWKPKLTDITASIFYAPIVDSLNVTAYSKDVQLVRLRATVFRNQTGTFHYKIRDVDYLERKEQFGTDPLEGVDVPAITPTKVPDMPQGLFLIPLYNVIRALGRILMNVIISAGTAVISGIDLLLVQLGLPPILSNAVAIFMLAFEIVTPIVTMLAQVSVSLVTNIVQIAEIMILSLPKFMVFMGFIVTDFVYFWTMLVDILTGQLFGINNIWQGLDVLSFVQLWLFGIFPVWEVERIEQSKDPLGQLQKDVGLFYSMLMGVFNMGMKFITILIDIINSLFNFLG